MTDTGHGRRSFDLERAAAASARLTGIVDELDPGMATVKAVLDAINRPLTRA